MNLHKKHNMLQYFSIGLIMSFLFIFGSCSPNSDTTDNEELQSNQRDSTFKLEGLAVPLLLHFPKAQIAETGIRNEYNAMFGQIEFGSGERFQILISEESISIAELKAELEEDLLFKYKFESENDSELLYLTILPDGTELSYQFMKKIDLQGKSFLIRSQPMGEYSLQNVELMKSVISGIETQ